MQRCALAPRRPTRESVLVAVPRLATDWSIARSNRGWHRLLVPVDDSLRATDALRYVADHVADHVAGVHLLNVQRPVMSGDVSRLVDVKTVVALRQRSGHRVLSLVHDAFAKTSLPITQEVAFGSPAEVICRVARKRGCTGIVLGWDGLRLRELVTGSVAAQVLKLAGVPVTIVSARAAVAHARTAADASRQAGDATKSGRHVESEARVGLARNGEDVMLAALP